MQAVNLGDAKVPAQILPGDRALVERSFHLAFIDAYARILRIAAVLAFAGALMAFIFIRKSVYKPPA